MFKLYFIALKLYFLAFEIYSITLKLYFPHLQPIIQEPSPAYCSSEKGSTSG